MRFKKDTDIMLPGTLSECSDFWQAFVNYCDKRTDIHELISDKLHQILRDEFYGSINIVERYVRNPWYDIKYDDNVHLKIDQTPYILKEFGLVRFKSFEHRTAFILRWS
jgi:hypothetical protein